MRFLSWQRRERIQVGRRQGSCLGSSGSGDGTWTFTIPAQGPDHEGETLRFSIRATDGDVTPEMNVDTDGGLYYGIDILDDDRAGPRISGVSYPALADLYAAFEVTAEISDGAAGDHGVASSTPWYGYASPFDQHLVAGVGPGGSGDGTWSFTVPAQGAGYDGQVLSFWLEAADGDNSAAVTAAGVPGPFEVLMGELERVFLPLILRGRRGRVWGECGARQPRPYARGPGPCSRRGVRGCSAAPGRLQSALSGILGARC